MVSTGWALVSTKKPNPSASRALTVSSKRTSWRRLVYQYSASAPAVSNSPPVTVE